MSGKYVEVYLTLKVKNDDPDDLNVGEEVADLIYDAVDGLGIHGQKSISVSAYDGSTLRYERG